MGLWQWLTGNRRPADEPAAPPVGSPPGLRRDWAALRPMQRAVVPTALLSDSARFAGTLVTRRNP